MIQDYSRSAFYKLLIFIFPRNEWSKTLKTLEKLIIRRVIKQRLENFNLYR